MADMSEIRAVGFIGLGVMGLPICRNIVTKSGLPVTAFDLDPAPVQRLAEFGVAAAASAAEVAQAADTILLSLPGAEQVTEVADALAEAMVPGQTLVDLGTTPVALTRDLARRFAALGVDYADAPVARTRAAAEAGTLSIQVGAEPEVFQRIEPLLRHAASEVSHCGAVGAGQIVKLMNNMVLFQTVNALAEALAIGRRAGVDGRVLLETMAKGSADSFALRNHGLKHMLPGSFPPRSFPTDYALKDLGYALKLADEMGVRARGAETTRTVLIQSRAAGNQDRYFPALIGVVDKADTGDDGDA